MLEVTLNDVIVIGGRNLYAQDIEEVVEVSHPALRPGYGAAFSVLVGGAERLVVVQEAGRYFQQWDLQEAVRCIRKAVATAFGLEVYAVELLSPGCLDTKYNGRFYRQDCRRDFLAKRLDVVLRWARTDERYAVLYPRLSESSHDTPGRDVCKKEEVPGCLHQIIEQQVERTPDAVAVSFEQQSLSYRELNERANQLAHFLQRAGVGPDVIVGVCMERSIELLVALLGILKAGGAYVPLDPGAPVERLAWMLGDVQPLMVLTQSSIISTLPSLDLQLFCIDSDSVRWLHESTQNPLSLVNSEHLAYIIYTSGSTGQPKGVMIPHRAICNSLLWMQETFQLTSQDSMLQKTPFVFDASLWELFWPLMTGARIVVARPEGHKDSAYLLSLTLQERITTLFFVPSMLQAFVEEPGLEQCQSVRQVLCGGEALSPELQVRFQKRHRARLYNLYGPTEAAIQVTCWECQRENVGSIIPIGEPITNTQIYLLDEHGQRVPMGDAGEIYIGGENLARGYLSRPDLTAECFVPDPFSQKSGARLYRTGDIGRYREDGQIECLGRVDQQIKLRGNRIELGEIEAALQSHPSVQQGVVLLREEVGTDKYLAAYLVIRDGEQTSIEELRQYLRKRLPEYMLPAIFVFLETMPLNTSGKVDRRALPVPDQRVLRANAEIVAPQTPLQEMLVALWCEVLRLPQVSIYDNFFDLGGHSLLATQVMSRIRQALHLELPLRTLFEAPTIASLAERLDADTRGTRSHRVTPLVAQEREKILPLSFAQERLWFLDQFAPQSAVCNVPIARRLSGSLSVEALEWSLAAVIQRHEALRTIFQMQEGRVTQVILPSLSVKIPVIDIHDRPALEQDEQVRLLIQREADLPFDLATGPLLRVCLMHLNEQEHVLLLTIHHIITDGWSMSVLMRELSALYNARIKGEVISLPELPVQYADYTLWQREWWQAGTLQEDLAYWQKQLAGAPTMLDLPTDRPRPAVQTYVGARQFVHLPAQLLQELKALSQREGVTLFMTLLASFNVLLSRYSGQQDIVVGAPIANRTREELEDSIGLFINTMVLRTDLSGNPGFRELLHRIREVALQAYMHQDLPFEKLVESLQLERSLSYAPLFQVFFTLQNGPGLNLDLEGISWRSLEVEQAVSKFDLSLTLTENEPGLSVELEYNTDLFDTTTMERLLGHWQVLLEAIVQDVEQSIGQLPLLTPDEVHQLQVEWNATTQPGQSFECLHQLVEQQVERTPDAIALFFENRDMMTYRELNTRANQLAHVLQRSGVGSDVLVGVYMERSLELVVALLAILKAGGAYLPLDPSYPAERLIYMIEDAQPALMLTQEHLLQTRTFPTKVICLDSEFRRFVDEPTINPACSVGSENLAYVIYTSGSTGRPKGVMNTHQGICNNMHWKREAYQITPRDRILHKTPLSFDVSVWELFLPLVTGASMVIARPEGHKDSAYLISLIKEYRVTTMEVVPSLLQVLIEEPGFGECHSLRLVICGGDTLSFELQQRFFSCHHAALYNTYGPTEAAIDATCWICERESTRNIVPIGLPIANTQIYILDAYGNPVPIGVPGEIYIGGLSLARGYLNRPGLTAERFIPDPFSATPGQRLYRTGDLARYQSDGAIEYLGRIDQQVKLRGFRIELGEIEAVLQAHSAVQEAIVLLREERGAQKFLAAYIVAQAGTDLRREDLRSFLSTQLPAYMIPTAFIMLDALPLSANGKLDRRALALQPITRSVHYETEGVAPRDSVESTLATIWMDLLKLERVSVFDNFFELGGHSLLAMQLLNRIKQQFGVSLPLATLFQVPTIAQEAELLQHREQKQSFMLSPIVTIKSGGNKPPFFCVHPVSGEAYSYLKLAQYLRPDRPFYGIQARGLHRGQAPHMSVEEMASHYIKELRKVQPEGPYLLGGYSFGGIVAFEMAQQLRAQGATVSLLAMIDASLYDKHAHGPRAWIRTLGKRNLGYTAKSGISFFDLVKSYMNITVSALHEQLSQSRPNHQLKYLFALLVKTILLPRDTNAAQVRRFLRVIKANDKCRRQYRPKMYQGRITLFCRESDGHDATTAWTPFSSEPIESYTVPGDHLTMIADPNVASLATYLQHCLDQADAIE